MAHILRMALFRHKYGRKAAGLLELVLGCQTSNSVTQSLPFNSFASPLMQNKAEQKKPHYSDMSIQTTKFIRPSKFELINISPAFAPNVHENTLITVFMKMCMTYNSYQNQFKLSRVLKYFVHSNNFKEFCSIVDKKLPEFSPSSLVPLLELYYFHSKESDALLKKVLKLVLENINDFTIQEKLHLYNRLKRSGFKNYESSEEILKALDVYLEVCFVNDLYRVRTTKELLELLNLENLPGYLRKGIVTKLLDESLEFTKAGTKESLTLIRNLSEGAYKVAKRDKVIELIRKYLFLTVSSSACVSVVNAYAKIVSEEPSYFDIEVMKALIDFYANRGHSPSHKIKVFYQMCLMGYWDEILIRTLYDFIVSECSGRVYDMMNSAEVLFRYSKEFLSADELRSVLRVFSNSDLGRLKFAEKCECCPALMYLGLDVKDLLNQIFLAVKNDTSVALSESNPLQLYHQAKALGVQGYDPPSEDLLNEMLKEEFRNLFSTDLDLGEYLNKDYVLKGCTTSDYHCLHFVAVFAPDGSTLDLSPYIKEPPLRTNVEDIKVPPECKLIVFQMYPDVQPIEFRNAPKTSGAYEFFMKSFQGLDYNFVPLTREFLRANAEGRRNFLERELDSNKHNGRRLTKILLEVWHKQNDRWNVRETSFGATEFSENRLAFCLLSEEGCAGKPKRPNMSVVRKPLTGSPSLAKLFPL